MPTFKEYMKEQRLTNRLVILTVGLVGALAGATLMFLFALLGIIAWRIKYY